MPGLPGVLPVGCQGCSQGVLSVAHMRPDEASRFDACLPLAVVGLQGEVKEDVYVAQIRLQEELFAAVDKAKGQATGFIPKAGRGSSAAHVPMRPMRCSPAQSAPMLCNDQAPAHTVLAPLPPCLPACLPCIDLACILAACPPERRRTCAPPSWPTSRWGSRGARPSSASTSLSRQASPSRLCGSACAACRPALAGPHTQAPHDRPALYTAQPQLSAPTHPACLQAMDEDQEGDTVEWRKVFEEDREFNQGGRAAGRPTARREGRRCKRRPPARLPGCLCHTRHTHARAHTHNQTCTCAHAPRPAGEFAESIRDQFLQERVEFFK